MAKQLVLVFVSLVLGALCGILVMHLTDRCVWLSKKDLSVDQPKTTVAVLAARWPPMLAQMSAEFDRQVNCKDANHEIRLLLVVLTTPNQQGVQYRQLGRDSIYKNLSSKITVKYVVGTKALRENVLSDLKKEQTKFGDLVMLSDVKDQYDELSRKVQSTIQWSDKHEFDYLVKTDDDVVVLIDNLLNALKELGCPRDLFMGHCYFMKKVMRKNSRWMNPNWYTCETFLPYCAGLGYVIGRPVVSALAKYGDKFKRTRLEDATMGLWLAPYHLTRSNDEDRFVLGLSCANNTIAAHQFKVSNFKMSTQNLIKTGSMCT